MLVAVGLAGSPFSSDPEQCSEDSVPLSVGCMECHPQTGSAALRSTVDHLVDVLLLGEQDQTHAPI